MVKNRNKPLDPFNISIYADYWHSKAARKAFGIKLKTARTCPEINKTE